MNEIIKAESLCKSFKHGNVKDTVLKDISFSLIRGECLGIVGESGSGKSTLVNILAGLEDADKGSVHIKPEVKIHMVFQNPVESFNPKIKLGSSVTEGMLNMGIKRSKAKKEAEKLFNECGLSIECIDKYPHQVSVGECQRAAFARAIACKPDILICDEATSALDVSVQAQILELLKSLIKNRGLSVLFVCHDLAVVQSICSRIAVMHDGKIVEQGSISSVINDPQNIYTKKLIDAVLFM